MVILTRRGVAGALQRGETARIHSGAPSIPFIVSSFTTYLQVGLVLGLLAVPRGWLRSGPKVRKKSSRRQKQEEWTPGRDPGDRSLRVTEEIAKPRNWIDLARAGLATWLLTLLLPELPGVAEWDALSRTLLIAGVLAAGCLVQTLRFESRLSLFAPVFYLQGVALGLLGPVPGLLAMVAAWGLSPMLPGPVSMLFCQGALATGLGLLLLDAEFGPALVAGGVTILPAMVAVLAKRRLNAGLEKKPKLVASRAERRD